MESRDTRAELTRKQGLFNYNRFNKKVEEPRDEETEAAEAAFTEKASDKNKLELGKMKGIIFEGKPKRIYRTNRNLEAVTLQDPKRVHQALREFNDLSANRVFEQMLNQIA
mmetsp:Transcript_42011/g.64344  ORF Transcript_42011/g.64344 Transcript_42011/m.64344 type:complete len:111 (+) Transcript_42011:376-708(+)